MITKNSTHKKDDSSHSQKLTPRLREELTNNIGNEMTVHEKEEKQKPHQESLNESSQANLMIQFVENCLKQKPELRASYDVLDIMTQRNLDFVSIQDVNAAVQKFVTARLRTNWKKNNAVKPATKSKNQASNLTHNAQGRSYDKNRRQNQTTSSTKARLARIATCIKSHLKKYQHQATDHVQTNYPIIDKHTKKLKSNQMHLKHKQWQHQARMCQHNYKNRRRKQIRLVQKSNLKNVGESSAEIPKLCYCKKYRFRRKVMQDSVDGSNLAHDSTSKVSQNAIIDACKRESKSWQLRRQIPESTSKIVEKSLRKKVSRKYNQATAMRLARDLGLSDVEGARKLLRLRPTSNVGRE